MTATGILIGCLRGRANAERVNVAAGTVDDGALEWKTMPRPIPVDLILHTLVESLLELPEDHLRDLARAISAHCIDPRLVADQWCDGAGTVHSSMWLTQRLRDECACGTVSAETRAMEVAIARRLADVGLAMLVTQNAEDRAAASLLLDASRLVVGLERTQAGADNGTASTIANLRKMRNAAVAENDLWHGWAKTVAGIPSSHNPTTRPSATPSRSASSPLRPPRAPLTSRWSRRSAPNSREHVTT